jgi:hypothetical protein
LPHPPQQAPAPAPSSSFTTGVDTDLCQFGVCEGGHLTQLNARGWFMGCPFPGDLFAQFSKLQGLYLSYNSLTVGQAMHSRCHRESQQQLRLRLPAGQTCGLCGAVCQASGHLHCPT